MKTFASALLIVKPLQLLLLFLLCLTHVNIKIRDFEPTDAQCCTVGYFFSFIFSIFLKNICPLLGENKYALKVNRLFKKKAKKDSLERRR